MSGVQENAKQTTNKHLSFFVVLGGLVAAHEKARKST
jgi:hypothetical protein